MKLRVTQLVNYVKPVKYQGKLTTGILEIQILVNSRKIEWLSMLQ